MERPARRRRVAPHELERRATREKIEDQNGHIRKDGQLLKSRAKGKDSRDGAIDDDRDMRRVETRMHIREGFGQETIAPKGEENARRTENVAGEETKRGNARAGEQQTATRARRESARPLRPGARWNTFRGCLPRMPCATNWMSR